MNYFDDPEHRRWRNHYDTWPDRQPKLLAFTEAFRLTALPEEGSSDLTCELLDTETGKTYRHKMYVAYEHDPCDMVLDEDYQPVEGFVTLLEYLYSDHHCSCHRRYAAIGAGLPEAEAGPDECAGGRFAIRAITYDSLPGVILYSETMTPAELEAALLATQVH